MDRRRGPPGRRAARFVCEHDLSASYTVLVGYSRPTIMYLILIKLKLLLRVTHTFAIYFSFQYKQSF